MGVETTQSSKKKVKEAIIARISGGQLRPGTAILTRESEKSVAPGVCDRPTLPGSHQFPLRHGKPLGEMKRLPFPANQLPYLPLAKGRLSLQALDPIAPALLRKNIRNAFRGFSNQANVQRDFLLPVLLLPDWNQGRTRDNCWGRQRPTGIPPIRFPGSFPNAVCVLFVPVSYTHLTLPTIYSV